VLLSIRRRAIPTQDMEALKAHLAAGKPLLAIRTSSHAFDERGKGKSGLVEWPTFDPEVLGGNYKGHHGAGSGTTVYWPGAGSPPPLVSGIKLPFTSKASLYKTGPLAESATLVLMGSIPDAKPEPVAWTHTYKSAKIFYTSLGHKTDFDNPQFVRLMSNATRWSLGMRIPAADEGPKKK